MATSSNAAAPAKKVDLPLTRQEAWVILRALARYGDSLPEAQRNERGHIIKPADPDKGPVTWVAERLLRLVGEPS